MNSDVLRPYARRLIRRFEVRGSRSRDLAWALAQGQTCKWSAGEIICHEGDPSREMYVILNGSVRILRNDWEGQPRALDILRPPSLLGQMGMVDGSSRSATCVAVGPVSGIIIRKAAFDRLMNEASIGGAAFRQQLLSTMMSQLSTTNRTIRTMMA